MTDIDRLIIQKFREALKASSKQPATVESYSRDAEEFLRYLKSIPLDMLVAPPESLLWFRDYLGQDAENSIRRKVIGIRQFYRFLASEKLILESPFDEMPIPERDDSLEAPLASKDLDTLISLVSQDNLKSCRDRAILLLLGLEGIKTHELIELQWKDFIVSATGTSVLHIPGDKSRSISLDSETKDSLLDYKHYFEKWRSTLQNQERINFCWIFVSFKGRDGSVVLPKMSRHGLKFMLSELGEKAKIKNLHSESLRHLAIEQLISSGKRPEDIMSHLGLRQLGNIGKHLAKKRVAHDQYQ